MSGKSNTATFDLNLGGDAKGKTSALSDELEGLRKKVEGGQDSLKGMTAALARLNSASVVDIASARELQQKIQAQKDSIGQATQAILKMGTSYEAITKQAKAYANEQDKIKKKLEEAKTTAAKVQTDKFNSALGKVSPTISGLKDKVSGLWETLSSSSGMELAALGMAAIAAAAVVAALAIAAFAVAASVALAKFILESANAARSAQLLRMAFAGTEQNATNLGTQVDALARKVPTAKAELNDLAAKLAESGLQGQTLVDTFNAIGQASAAGADKAAAKIQEIADRSKLMGRTQINPFELIGTGLKFDDIAASLAKNMNVGVDDARQALLQGRVKLGDAAAAMRGAVEAKFGKINAAKMLDIGVQFDKFKENLAAMASKVNIEPLLKDLSDIFALFSDQTVTGTGIQALVEAFGSGFVDTVHGSTPVAKQFIEELVIGALEVHLAWLNFRIGLRDTFADSKVLQGLDAFQSKLHLVRSALTYLGGPMTWIMVGILHLSDIIGFLSEKLETIKVGAANLGDTFSTLGQSILDGLLAPLQDLSKIENIATVFSGTLKKKLKALFGINSPSRVMHQEIGLHLGTGAVGGMAEGVEEGLPAVSSSLESLASKGSGTGVAAGGAANGNAGAPKATELHLHFHVDSEPTARALQEPSGLAAMTKAIEELLLTAGMPVRA